jgi:hypothetical protein
MISGPPSIDHGGNQFGRILQVCVEDNDGVAPRKDQAGRDGDLMTEISGQARVAHAGIALLQIAHHFQRIVVASIIHQHDFALSVEAVHNLRQAPIGLQEGLLFIEDGEDE